MRRLRITLLLTLALSLSVVFTAAAQDATEEPDTAILTLPILADGEPIDTSFDSDLDGQLFAFNATEGDVVTISMTQAEDSTLDPYIILLGDDGAVYANDDDTGGNLSSLIEDFTIPKSGSFFILATTYSGIRDGSISADDGTVVEGLNYSIEVSGNTQPEDITEGFQYFAGKLEIGDTVTVEITLEAPIFYVTFIAEKGQTISVGAQGVDGDGDNLPDVDTLLYLFDYAGNRLTVDDDNGDAPLASLIANFEVPQDGLYFAFVTAYNFADATTEEWDSAGQIEISVQ